jgi:hypothetical protein
MFLSGFATCFLHISCRQVLLALPSGNPWTNEDIDQLLAQADASGDGELQVQARH